MSATTATTLQGVSLLTKQKARHPDKFELVLSHAGIEVRRPDRPVQHMSWDRVSEWEIEECKGYLLLTLRGRGATTPLVVPGWTLEALEVLMRDVTSDAASYQPKGPGPVVADGTNGRATAAPRTAPAPSAPPAPAAPAAPPVATPAPAAKRRPTPTRAERRQQAVRVARRRAFPLKAVATVVLLGALATAVIVVLLQSAGVIDWSFLGPVA